MLAPAFLSQLLRRLMPPMPGSDKGWLSAVWLIYLGFLFLPLTWRTASWSWLGPTLLSLPIFLVLYFLHHQPARRTSLIEPIAIAVLGLLLTPSNAYSTVYIIFSCALAPFPLAGIWRPLLYMFVVIGVYFAELVWVGVPQAFLLVGITTVSASAAYLGNVFYIDGARKSRALQASNAEIRRLAAVAERERIARDLHDLLGHTLSLVVIKSELAEKLVRRDAEAAAREIADVKNISRETLREVRTAVSGIRSAAVEGELAAARLLLESSGVELTTRQTDTALPADVENTIAMILREAATNIHRHAGARHATVDIVAEQQVARLIVSDDGRGGIGLHGNGLKGIAERVRESGGSLEIRSPPGGGTVLIVRLPLSASASGDESGVSATRAQGAKHGGHAEGMAQSVRATQDATAQ